MWWFAWLWPQPLLAKHKDYTHQKPEEAQLNDNMCRETISPRSLRAGLDSYRPTSRTVCQEICSISSTGAATPVQRTGQRHSKTREQHNTLNGEAPLATQKPGGSFPTTYFMPHHCNTSLLATSATPTLLGRSSSFVRHPPPPNVQGRFNQQDGIAKAIRKEKTKQSNKQHTKPQEHHK